MTDPHAPAPVDPASNDATTSTDVDETVLTPMQIAIRQRAQETLALRARQQHTPRSRWIFGALFMALMVVVFLFTVDVSVRTMHTILDILLPHASAPAPVDPKQPYYISVEPDSAGAAEKGAASSEANHSGK